VALVPNGIEVERVRQTGIPGACRHELRIPDNAPLVAYVGRNARVKNIPRLLAVTRRLLDQSPGLHVVIAGEGLDRRIVTCTDLAHNPRVHCIGTRQDIPSLLRDANLLILTSDSEGTPNVILEALAVCVPVVATAVGDLPKVLPQTCGALVAPDSDQLASAALRVLSSGSSLRGALQLQAEHISNAYSLQAMVNRTTAVWTRVMDSSGSAFDQPDVPFAHPSDHVEKKND
jgi:starch synthase (maltosyl-transferring)